MKSFDSMSIAYKESLIGFGFQLTFTYVIVVGHPNTFNIEYSTSLLDHTLIVVLKSMVVDNEQFTR